MMASVRSVICKSFVLLLLPFVVSSRSDLKILNDQTWRDMLVGEWMVEFFAPWCPACRQLEPIWKEFASWGDDLNIQVAAIDITTNPGLSGRFAITALPTIFHVKDGVFRQYRGSKRKEELISFIDDAKWKEIEPIPEWKSPQSFQMSSLAYFFKLSMFLRTVHNEIVEFGVPYWVSYTLFGLGTILLGTFLGLLIVCAIDYICPTKRPPQQHAEARKKSVKKHEEKEQEEEHGGSVEKVEDVCKPSQDDDDAGEAEHIGAGEAASSGGNVVEEQELRKRVPPKAAECEESTSE